MPDDGNHKQGQEPAERTDQNLLEAQDEFEGWPPAWVLRFDSFRETITGAEKKRQQRPNQTRGQGRRPQEAVRRRCRQRRVMKEQSGNGQQ